MLFSRASLVPILAGAMVVSSCSMLGESEDSGSLAAPFTTINSGETSTAESTGPKASQSVKAKDGRDPEDFAVEDADIESYGVKSAGIECLIQPEKTDDGAYISCDFEFNDPPLMPEVGGRDFRSNSVGYKSGKGFSPLVRYGGETIPMVELKGGESVELGDVLVEAESDTKVTVNYDGHYSTYDGGEYFSDTFPPTKDANGNADVGVVCGEYIHPGGDRGYIYSVEDGTNCDTAKAVLASYKESDAYSDRGAADIDGWNCRYHRLEGWPESEGERLGCSSAAGYFMVFIPER